MKFFTITGIEKIETDLNRWLCITFDDGKNACILMPSAHTQPTSCDTFWRIINAGKAKHGLPITSEDFRISQLIGLRFCELDFAEIGIDRLEAGI